MINVIGIRVGAPIISSGVLPAPFATAATGVTSTSFTANWNAYTGAAFYLLDVSLSNTFSSFVGAYQNFVVMSTSQVVSGLTSSTTYYYRVRAAVSVDSDTVSFMTRVYSGGGSLTYTETVATDDLVTNLKSFSLWSKMSALYPMVGGSPASTAQNLKSSSFTGTLNGGWTVSPTEITTNGVNSYFNTGYNPSVQLGSNYGAFSVYWRNTFPSGTNIMGASTNSSSDRFDLGYDSGVSIPFVAVGNTNSTTGSDTDNRGFVLATRQTASSNKLFRNGSLIVNGSLSFTSNPNYNFYLGARNNGGGIDYFTNNQRISFASIGNGLTDTEAGNFYACVQGLQTTLGRQIGAPWYNNGNQLLDTYSGTIGAYSLNKIRNTYVGAAIRIRRSSDNAEYDIYFDSTGLLDTSQLAAICSGTNGFVTTWYDQSGNGRNITQSTAANQPQIVSSGTILTRNSKPTVRFTKASNHNLQNASIVASGDMTFSWVGSATLPVTNWSYVFGFGSYSPTSGYQYSPSMFSNANDWIAGDLGLVGNGYNPGQNPRFVSNGAQYTSDVQAITLGILSSSVSTVYKNNSAVTSRVANTGSVPSATGLWVGTNSLGEGLQGDIQELIFWNSNQNSNASGINSSINSKYNTY